MLLMLLPCRIAEPQRAPRPATPFTSRSQGCRDPLRTGAVPTSAPPAHPRLHLTHVHVLQDASPCSDCPVDEGASLDEGASVEAEPEEVTAEEPQVGSRASSLYCRQCSALHRSVRAAEQPAAQCMRWHAACTHTLYRLPPWLPYSLSRLPRARERWRCRRPRRTSPSQRRRQVCGACVRGCCKWSAVGMFKRKLSTPLHHPHMASSRASTALKPAHHPPSPICPCRRRCCGAQRAGDPR